VGVEGPRQIKFAAHAEVFEAGGALPGTSAGTHMLRGPLTQYAEQDSQSALREIAANANCIGVDLRLILDASAQSMRLPSPMC